MQQTAPENNTGRNNFQFCFMKQPDLDTKFEKTRYKQGYCRPVLLMKNAPFLNIW